MALTPDERKLKNSEIKAFHQSTLDALGVPNAVMISKMAYSPSGFSERHIAFFESELNKEVDIYIEFGDTNLVAEKIEGYPLRSLLKYRANSQYKTEYTASDPTAGPVRFFVPIAELVLVTKPEPQKLRTTKPETARIERESTVSDLIIEPPIDDPSMKEMTLRDYAAIHLKKKCSKKQWLNLLITE